MKKIENIAYYLFLGVLFVAVSSCGNDISREDKVSTIISQVEGPIAILNMVPGEIIKKSGVSDGALPYTQKMMLDFFITDSLTGVDYDVDVQIIIGGGTQFTPNFYGIFKLKDEAAFIELLTTEANAKVAEQDGFKYVIKDSDMYVIVWNDEFVIASNIPMSMSSMMGGSGSKEGKKTVDKLIGFINSADEEPVTTYSEFLSNDADISLHVMGEGMYAYIAGMSMDEESELEKIREMLEASSGDMFIRFNDGDISIQILSSLSDKLIAQMNMWNETAVNAKYLAFGSSSQPMYTMGSSMNVEKFVKEAQSEDALFDAGMLIKELEKMGLTLNDANNALDGDVFFVLDRLEIKKEVIDWGYGDPYVIYNPTPIFSIAAGVKDMGIIQNIFAKFDSVSAGLYKNGDAYLTCVNNVLFTTNDSTWAANFMSGNTVQIKDAEGVFTDKPFGLYLDFAKIAEMPDMGDEKALIEMMKYAKGLGDVNEMNLSFVFKDDSRNALRILTESISRMSEEKPQTEEALEIQSELEEAIQ